MPRVEFTSHLLRHVDCQPQQVAATTLREALELACAPQPHLRGYVLDERGRLRQHIAVFVDGRPVVDRVQLSDPVGPDSQIYVLQALSGG